MPDYPKRQSFHAMRVIRKMAKSCAAQEIGSNACLLIVIIAVCEDVKRYTAPVTYYNDQLLSIMGLQKWESLDRARRKAIAAGWIHYECRGRRQSGLYWTEIPPQFDRLDDSPTDETERLSPVVGDNSVHLSPADGHKGGDKGGDKRGYNAGDKGGELSYLPLNPTPPPTKGDPAIPREWKKLAERLGGEGMVKVRDCLAALVARGIPHPEAVGIFKYWSRHRVDNTTQKTTVSAWNVGALYARLMNHVSGMDASSGWPPKSDQWQRFASSESGREFLQER